MGTWYALTVKHEFIVSPSVEFHMIEAPENGETTLSRVGEIHSEMGENSRIVWKIPYALGWCQVRRGQFFSRFWGRPWLRALCGCMVSCFSHFPRRKASYLHIYTRFFCRHPKDMCFRPRQSWDVLGCDGGFHLSKLSKRLEIEGPTRTYLLSLRVKDLRAAILRLWLR